MTNRTKPDASAQPEALEGTTDAYYREAATWSADRHAADTRSRTLAWTTAGIAIALALIEAIALAVLTPLRRDVPYTLLVDRETGYVEALKPLEQTQIDADSALTRSFLVQYVIARERFGIDFLAEDYRKVALLSEAGARARYVASMQRGNPASPLNTLPRQAIVNVTIRSVSSLGADIALVRFTTQRTDPAGVDQPPRTWASVIKYRYSAAEMTADDRLVNPLGFQVVRYRRDPETLPVEQAVTPTQPVPVVARSPRATPPGAEDPR